MIDKVQPTRIRPRLSLAQFLAPRSVAVIGASEDTGKFGGRMLHHLVKHGYRGRIVPVNPNRPALLGLPTVPTISAAGEIDVAAIAVPPDLVVENIEACAAAGVGGVVVITAQMGEIGGEGLLRERRIVSVARAVGMRILGPNCLGFVNIPAGLAFTPSFAMGVERLSRGRVAIVSQSGALMATMYNYGHDHGIGFSTLASIGNQADITESDVLEHLIADPQTGAVTLYLEGLSDPHRFLSLAERARAAGKPLVVAKVGRTEEGRRAAYSHTASIAGSFRLFETALRSRGAILSDDPEAAVMLADAVLRWPQGLGTGKGVAASSGSGGGVGILADRLAEAGFATPNLSSAARTTLAPQLGGAKEPLPLDLGAVKHAAKIETGLDVLATILGDSAVGALLHVMTTQPQMLQTARGIAQIAERQGKPAILVLSAGSVADDVRTELRQIGFPFHDRLDDAIRVVRALVDAVPGDPVSPVPVVAAIEADAGAIRAAAVGLPSGSLTPVEAQALVGAAGVPTLPFALVHDVETAVEATARIGVPAVAKLVSREITHKSDRGGVWLNLASPTAVGDSVAALKREFGAAFDGALLQPYAPGIAELIVGTLWDDGLGSFVLVGAGGLFADLFADNRILPAPVDEAAAAAAMAELRIWPVLQGARGRPTADVGAAAAAIAAVSRLAAVLGARLTELDINPLILYAAGRGVAAADVRARLAPAGNTLPRIEGKPS
jgi:acyl-CoA synthetase (NDP forming)